MVELPRPAGVVLALTPSTNPVSTVYFKILLALLTRNAIVISPHPFAKECCSDAARLLGDAAVAAGAPDGVVQVVEEPSIPLIDALMTDDRTDVILATGGVAVVRAAYSSGNPAIGVGPGNVPVLVDATANLKRAAEKLVSSKAFDNSLLCTNESVLIVEESVADRFLREMERQGAYVLKDEERDRVRETLFPPRRGFGCRDEHASSSHRSTSRSARSRWPTRSCARCWVSSGCPVRVAGCGPPLRSCASVVPAIRP
jgi:acyl-CoA reductase-like NAD-dependent aldehyde dehydrogenase